MKLLRLLALALVAGLAACSSTGPLAGRAKGPKLELSFPGATRFSTRDLLDELALDLADLPGRANPRSALEDAAWTLVELYRDEGYPACRVETQLVEVTTERIVAQFRVDEGARVRVERIDVDGNRRIKEDELLESAGLEARPRTTVWFVERELQLAADALAAHYAARGHLDVRVEGPDVTLDTSGGLAAVRFHVEEGPRYTLLDVPKVSGGVPAVNARLELGVAAGRALTPRLPLDLRARVTEHYEREGYPDVTVELQELPPDADARVALELSIAAGPQVRIREVQVTGNDKTRTSHVLELVTLRRGDVYDVREIRESFRQLYKSGLFRRVDLALERTGESERALVVTLEETVSTEVFVEPGYGSYEGLRALGGVRETNLFGSGLTVSLDGMVAERASRTVAGVSEPRLLGSNYELGLSLFQELRDEPAYDKDERGGAVTLSRELAPRLRAALEYRYRNSRVTNVDVTATVDPATFDSVDISSIALSTISDQRDSVFVPTEGNLLRLRAEYASAALGSELEFLRVQFTETWLKSLREGTVLAASWRGGVVVPLESTDVIPLQERFFNGGENTVRSYREDELGPRDVSGTPIGGEGFQVLSLELRQRLRGALEAAAFWDAGTLAPVADDFWRYDDVRHGLGVGLRYLLPIGPLRIDSAWNPSPEDGEDRWRAHFSIGMAF
jgi:outer membrane protein assembly complex protein YaeT